MVYNSIVFIFYFLPVLLMVYYLLPRVWLKNIFLFLSSIVFYIWGAGNLIILLLAVGISAWGFSWLIAKTRLKKLFLFIAVFVYVAVLIYFKYLGFIVDNLIYIGVNNLHEVKPITALGISFFTFQAISYNIDVYRKDKRFEKNPANVVLYITMFPQLISGPLVRYDQIQQQIKTREFNIPLFSEGVRRFIIGLAKKALIADPLGYLVSKIVDNDAIVISPAVAWAGMAVFAIQILFDFSGYTDMAIGAGKMLGFNLPENFNYPYISKSITEFWRRWHMTFAKWIKDYIFSPLAFSMRYWGKAGIFISIMITFTVCGIWHGPTWNYILWGVIQGLLLGLEELFLLKYLKRLKGFSLLYVLFVIITCVVLFRNPDMKHALHYYSVMFSPAQAGALGLNSFFTIEHTVILCLGILFCIPFTIPEKLKTGNIGRVVEVITVILLIAIFILSAMKVVTGTYYPFIYFKF